MIDIFVKKQSNVRSDWTILLESLSRVHMIVSASTVGRVKGGVLVSVKNEGITVTSLYFAHTNTTTPAYISILLCCFNFAFGIALYLETRDVCS